MRWRVYDFDWKLRWSTLLVERDTGRRISLIGHRIGKYVNGKLWTKPRRQVLPLAALIGYFMLWLGWFGFNGGSVLSARSAISFLCFGDYFARWRLCWRISADSSRSLLEISLFKRLDLARLMLMAIFGRTGRNHCWLPDVILQRSAILSLALVSWSIGSLFCHGAICGDRFSARWCCRCSFCAFDLRSLRVHFAVWNFFSTNPRAHTFITHLSRRSNLSERALFLCFLIFFNWKRQLGIRVSEEHGESAFGLSWAWNQRPLYYCLWRNSQF